MSLHLKIVSLKKAGPPEFFGNKIIFTYKAHKPTRLVAAIFEHEDFTKLQIFKKNKYNIFFLIYPIPEDVKLLKYRIIVDGLYMEDPQNSNTEKDPNGLSYSIITLDQFLTKSIENPEIVDDSTVCFRLKTKPGKNVHIVGNFNDWDPFMHRLKEEPPGYYSISIRVSTGRYYYYFLIDSEKRLDPYNKWILISSNGEEVCTFDIP